MRAGGGLDYKPASVKQLQEDRLIDRAVVVPDQEALAMCRTVAQHDGILVGPSTGSAIFAALSEAERDSSIKRVGLLACDDGRAYMSSIMDQFNPLLDTPNKMRERVQTTPLTSQDLLEGADSKQRIDWSQHSFASTSYAHTANQPPQSNVRACTKHGCMPVDGRASAHMAGTDPPSQNNNTMHPDGCINGRGQRDKVEPKSLRQVQNA